MSSFKPITWYKSNYIAESDGYIALSDIFYNVFKYLGSEVVVFDPYFIGNLNEDLTTKALSIASEDQKAFLNAIGRYLFETNFSVKIAIYGCPNRAKSQVTKDSSCESTKMEGLYNKYQKYLNGLMPPYKLYPKYVDFFVAAYEFHNRYYFSKVTIGGSTSLSKPFVVTNSIGNLKEVDIIPVEDESQANMICSKYVSLLSSKSINEVLNG